MAINKVEQIRFQDERENKTTVKAGKVEPLLSCPCLLLEQEAYIWFQQNIKPSI